MKRRNEDGPCGGAARSPCFGSVMDRHGQQQVCSAGRTRLRHLMLAQMNTVGAPALGARRRSREDDDESAPRRDTFQPPQQAPALGVGQCVVTQDDAAAWRQLDGEPRERHPHAFVAQQPEHGQRGLVSGHRAFYRRGATARNGRAEQEAG